MRVLLVEDDPSLRDFLVRVIRDAAWAVDAVGDGRSALTALAGADYDLAVLDVGLPGMDGFEVCRTMRANGDRTPVLILTARQSVNDRVYGLDVGADDYLAKPFEPRELLLRIQNIIRRGKASPAPRDEVRMGEYVFHVGRGELKRGDELIKLTERERDLLRLFAGRPGSPIARHELGVDGESRRGIVRAATHCPAGASRVQ